MRNNNSERNPILRKMIGGKPINAIPDLTYEISEQSLDGTSGGTTSPICASVVATIYLVTLITASATGQGWDGPPPPGEK